MRLNRLLHFVTVVLVSLTAVTGFSTSASATAATYPYNEIETENLVQAQGNVDPYFVDLANEQLNMLPTGLRSQFVEDG